MHSHTMWSGDSTTTPDEIAAAVADSGIDVLCITDHNAIKGAVDLVDRLPCRVIVGEELRTHAGEVIGLFLGERIPVGLQPEEAARAIRAQGGIVYDSDAIPGIRVYFAKGCIRQNSKTVVSANAKSCFGDPLAAVRCLHKRADLRIRGRRI